MEIASKPAPKLNLPRSNTTVRVRVIDTEAKLVVNSNAFVQPPIKGHEKLNLTTMCFLVEHEGSEGTEYVLFDCGPRKDLWNTTPKTQQKIGSFVPGVEVERGVDEVLTSKGFDLNNLRAMVWSHWHWDHIGDGSRYPDATDIIVGPGFKENFVPGWPDDPEGRVPASSLKGHRIHEIDFPLEVGGFPAHDYFGDGSFYLLDVPGHAIAHICGFARTTPDTFVFMGGDCSHYGGMLRPTPYLPMPSNIPQDQLDAYFPAPCPCSAFTIHHPLSSTNCGGDNNEIKARSHPFYDASRDPSGAYDFGDIAQESIDKVKALDAQDNVFICLAHDGALVKTLPLYNKDASADINDWKACGYKEKTRWEFLNELPRDGKAGRKPLAEGIWKNGHRLVWKDGQGLVEVPSS